MGSDSERGCADGSGDVLPWVLAAMGAVAKGRGAVEEGESDCGGGVRDGSCERSREARRIALLHLLRDGTHLSKSKVVTFPKDRISPGGRHRTPTSSAQPVPPRNLPCIACVLSPPMAKGEILAFSETVRQNNRECWYQV